MSTCFVIMGFGEKTDLATGRKLDLDKTYKNIIKPAITAAGYDCVRADEVLHSGVIDVPMYDMLFGADLVVADLSTSNLNAVFELGVRHALRPRSTIVIAEQEFRNPFDVNHIVIRPYRHLGSDIGFDETMRVRQELQSLAEALKVHPSVDSPVYTLLPDLEEPRRRAVPETEAALRRPSKPDESETLAALLKIAFEARDACDFDLAKAMLRKVYEQQIAPGPDGKPRPAWPCVIRDLALTTFQAGDKAALTLGPEAVESACAEAIGLLARLGPDSTTDPETLRLWSLFHGYRAQLPIGTDEEKRAGLEIAIESAERSFAVKRDPLDGSSLALLLNLRASMSSGDERIADWVRAERVRRKVVDLATEQLAAFESEGVAQGTEAVASGALAAQKFWTMASLAESLVALHDPSGPALLQKALGSAPTKWMRAVTEQRIEKLESILAALEE